MKLRPLISIFISTIALWLMGFMAFLVVIGTSVPEHPNEKTDAIVVLTGSSERLGVALQLLEKGLADELFISGVGGGAELSSIYPDEASKGKLENLKGQIILGTEAPDTVGNARETVLWMNTRKHKKIRLVTSNYHMPRSLVEFSRVVDDDIVILPHPVLSVDMVGGEALRTPKVAWMLFKEYNKYLAAWLRAKAEKVV